MRVPFILLLLLLPSTFATAQPVGEERGSFGPLQFGMSIEEVRAATPGTEWLVLAGAQESNVAYEIKAARLLELGGFRYDVKVGSRYGGSHHWEILSTAASAHAAECDSRTAALITELEHRFGGFEITAPPIGTEAVVSVGRFSKMKTDAVTANLRGIPRDQALKKGAARYYVRAKHVPVAEDDPEIMVLVDYEAARGHECSVRVQIDGYTPPPPGLESFDPARVISRPSISFRNRSLRDLGVPPQPLEFLVPCNFRASNGKVGSCINGPAHQAIDPYRKLAASWALQYQFAVRNDDPNEQTVHSIEIPITVSASDARDVDFGSGAVLDIRNLKVVSGNRVDPADYSPDDPKLRKIPADITLRCKVQEDGSLICGLKPGTSSPAEEFTRAAIRLAENLEIETTLRDGTSAIGGVFDRRIRFNTL
jgi:hypothetical protein